MTDTLHVRRFDVRYRVAEDDAVVRARLDALLARVLEHDLEPALVERGLPVGEEICVRDVHAPARVRLTTGAAAAGVLSAAIADAIAAAIARGGADVVRYRSRRAALADIALSVAAGRVERVWAWRRIGLWRGGDAPAPRDAAAELAAALAVEPKSVVAVLARVARAGALPRLVELIADAEWGRLARAALAAAGAPAGIAAAGAGAVRVDADAATAGAAATAMRVARDSAIAAAARSGES